MTFLGRFFSSTFVILSGPGALLFGSFVLILCMMWGVIVMCVVENGSVFLVV